MTDRFRGRTILITGAGGFVGSSIVGQLRRIDCTVRRVSRRPLPVEAESGLATVEDLVGDVRDIDTWKRAVVGADIVLHLAAQTSVPVADADPAADFAANVQPMLHLCDACRATGSRPAVVAAGTATEVGLTRGREPIDESRADEPITFYDLHKLMAERYLELFTRLEVMRAATLRLANVYGPGPLGSSRDRGFLNAMVRRALGGEALTIYGTGAVVRDYVFVEDVAEAFLAAAASIDAVQGRHFLVGSGRGTTVAEALALVADRVARVTGRRVPVVSVDPPPAMSPIESRDFVADTSRLRESTGWAARTGLADGIDRTIERFQ